MKNNRRRNLVPLSLSGRPAGLSLFVYRGVILYATQDYVALQYIYNLQSMPLFVKSWHVALN